MPSLQTQPRKVGSSLTAQSSSPINHSQALGPVLLVCVIHSFFAVIEQVLYFGCITLACSLVDLPYSSVFCEVSGSTEALRGLTRTPTPQEGPPRAVGGAQGRRVLAPHARGLHGGVADLTGSHPPFACRGLLNQYRAYNQ
jgi:hypothetical protein